jgi:hypothetical protein
MNEELIKALKWLEAVTRGVGKESVVTDESGNLRCKKWTWQDRDAAESAVLAIFERERAVAKQLAEALRDMKAGWEYIRKNHGDLYGVGWERCAKSSSAALAAYEALEAKG